MACLYACCWFRFFSCGVGFFFGGICSSNRLAIKDRRSDRISAVLSIGGIFVVVVVLGLNLLCAADCGAVGVRLYGLVFAAFFVGFVSSVLTGGGVCAIGGIFVVVVVLIGWNLRTLLPLLSSSSCAVDLDAVCVGDVIGGICRIGLYGLASWVFFVVFLCVISLSYG